MRKSVDHGWDKTPGVHLAPVGFSASDIDNHILRTTERKEYSQTGNMQ